MSGRDLVAHVRLGLRTRASSVRGKLDSVVAEGGDLAILGQASSRARERAGREWERARFVRHHLADLPVWLLRAAASRPRPTAVGNRILMLTISSIDHDPRPNKVARSLVAAGFEVDIIAPTLEPEPAEYEVETGIRYVRVPITSPTQVFIVYQEEFLRAALARDFEYVHANDLTTLTVAWIVARVRRVPLVYDAHELWTENVQLKGGEWVPMSPRTRAVAVRWEQFLLRSVDLLVTVGPSIVREFARRNGSRRPPLLLANYPSLELLRSKPPAASIREACGVTDAHFVTLYMGGVNPLRNIETVIEAHRHLPEDHVFVIMGPGVEFYEGEYRAAAADAGVEHRVFFVPAVGMDEVVAAATDADCGIVMLRNICKNFYFFYPNKLFEYALAGLPIAASSFPDVSGFIHGEKCGVTFDPDSAESIAAALLSLSADREEARRLGERGRAAILERYNWEAAVEGLVDAYRHLDA